MPAKKKKMGGGKSQKKTAKSGGKGGGSAPARNIAAARSKAFRGTYFRTVAGVNGSTRIMGRELVQEIQTSVGFSLQLSHSVNPSNPLLFPRLSSVATAFEQCSFKSAPNRAGGLYLRFCYEGGCPTSTAGTILHYFDYDVVTPPNSSSVRVLANETAVECAAWSDSCINVDVAKQFSDKLFISSGLNQSSLSAAEARQQYLGRVNFYADKGPASNTFSGYLYVEYCVDLFTPVPAAPISIAAQSLVPGSSIVAGGSCSYPLPSILSLEGINPQSAVGVGSSYTNNNAAGVAGFLDAAKVVYEAGTYAIDAWAEWGAASVDVQQLSLTALRARMAENAKRERKHESFAKGIGCECKTREKSSLQSYRVTKEKWFAHDGPKPIESPATSGDIIYQLYVYDVTAGAIDPNFPVSQSGMNNVSMQAFTISGGTGAYATGVGVAFDPVTVPTGSQYMWLLRSMLGITTGRAQTSGMLMGVNLIDGVVNGYAIE